MTDCNGIIIGVGDEVFTENGEHGPITDIYENEDVVDIHHSDSHQGPVIDSFDIVGHQVQKLEV